MKSIQLLPISLALISPTALTAQKPPNIVVIFCDDMGYGDLCTNNATGFVTSNLDRLATEGMRFTNFYAAQAVSSASRAGLLTGCYPNRVGITGALTPISNIGINPEEQTIAEILKIKGYSTAAVGKWHLGHQTEFLPLQNGFDEYFGIPYSNDMWPRDENGERVEASNKMANYPELPILEGNTIIRTITNMDEQSEITTLYTNRAISFIHKNKKNRSFFILHILCHMCLLLFQQNLKAKANKDCMEM